VVADRMSGGMRLLTRSRAFQKVARESVVVVRGETV